MDSNHRLPLTFFSPTPLQTLQGMCAASDVARHTHGRVSRSSTWTQYFPAHKDAWSFSNTSYFLFCFALRPELPFRGIHLMPPTRLWLQSVEMYLLATNNCCPCSRSLPVKLWNRSWSSAGESPALKQAPSDPIQGRTRKGGRREWPPAISIRTSMAQWPRDGGAHQNFPRSELPTMNSEEVASGKLLSWSLPVQS